MLALKQLRTTSMVYRVRECGR